MERSRDGQHHGLLDAQRRGTVNRRLDRHSRTRDHNLTRCIIIGNRADPDQRTGINRLLGHVFIGAEQRSHGAEPDRNGLLHGTATQSEQFRSITDRQGTGRRQGRVLAQAVTGNEFRRADINTEFGFEHAHHRQTGRHQGWLGVLRQRQILDRAVCHQAGEILPKGLVHLGQNSACDGKFGRQFLAHANGLAALTGKYECKRHQNASHQLN